MAVLSKIYFGLNKVSDKVSKILEALAAWLTILCCGTLLFQVFYRFIIVKFFAFSFPFTEEFARYALIWSTYLCLGMCLKEGSMAAVNLIFDRLGPKSKLLLYCLTRIFMTIFIVIGIWVGIEVVQNNLIFKSPTMRVPGVFLFSAPVVGCILMGFEMITEWIGVLAGELKPFAAGAIETEDEVDLSNLEMVNY